MNKTKIEWTDFSWNPIRGLCPVNCKLPDGKEYCYARRDYRRFGWDPEIRFDLRGTLLTRKRPKAKPGSKLFICSTFELFHPAVKKEWRDAIFSVIQLNPHHTIQILTKFPENIDREMPDNVWLGVTITGADETEDCIRVDDLWDQTARIKFISFEPMLDYCGIIFDGIDWLIMGRLTRHGKRYDPKRQWIEGMIEKARKSDIAVFLKDNLKPIMGDNLIQEFPND